MRREPSGDRSASPAQGTGVPPRRDRYGSLLESLRAADADGARVTGGRTAAPAVRPSVPVIWRGWHPVARTIVVVAIVAALAYMALLFTNESIRASRVDTWAGPDESVQSGMALARCPAAEGHGDEVFPSWIRYGGEVFASNGRVSPIGRAWQYGQTRYDESDYRLGRIRLLLDVPSPGSATPDTVFLLQEPAQVARLYDRIECP